jgi:hypothetical protein
MAQSLRPLLLIMALLFAICVQYQICDTESFLNAESSTDLNLDYDADGDSEESRPVEDLVKLQQMISFLEPSLIFLIILQMLIRRLRFFQPKIILKDFVLFIFRPPAQSVLSDLI